MTDKSRDSLHNGWTEDEESGITLAELASLLNARRRLIALSTAAVALLALGAAFLIPPWFTGTTVILPPQQQQSSAAAAISQLGALAGLAGGLVGVKSPADQYVALMQSTTVSDSIIDRFKLQDIYETKFRQDTRRQLKANVRIGVGRKDGLITVEVDDRDPARAAAMANAYVDALRTLTNSLAVSEAQQRRLFFEQQLSQTKERLAKAQAALEGSGFGQGALKVEPKTAAENYARLRAQATAAEVRLQTLRRMLAENTPEVMQQEASLNALREQVARAERQDAGRSGSEYIDRYREFKYQEALFDIFVKQFELAKVDESREGALIQVVDIAQPPERKSGPKRAVIAIVAAMITLFLTGTYALVGGVLARNRQLPSST